VIALGALAKQAVANRDHVRSMKTLEEIARRRGLAYTDHRADRIFQTISVVYTNLALLAIRQSNPVTEPGSTTDLGPLGPGWARENLPEGIKQTLGALTTIDDAQAQTSVQSRLARDRVR
jgi:hypothetical protein